MRLFGRLKKSNVSKNNFDSYYNRDNEAINNYLKEIRLANEFMLNRKYGTVEQKIERKNRDIELIKEKYLSIYGAGELNGRYPWAYDMEAN